MIASFEFATAARILFGRGRASELPALARDLPGPVLLVTGADPGRFGRLMADLHRSVEIGCEVKVTGEPKVAQVEELARAARAASCRSIHRGSHHRRDRIRGHAERCSRESRSSDQSERAKPDNASQGRPR